VAELENARGVLTGLQRWSKAEHLARMTASKCFRFTKETVIHHVEAGNAERLVGLARSQGHVSMLLKKGLSESDLGLDELAKVAQATLGEASKPWYFSYRVRLGIV